MREQRKAAPAQGRRTTGAGPKPNAGVSPATARPKPAATRPRPGAKVPVADKTPEDALKTFLLALAAQDAETLRAVAMPDTEFPLLLNDQPAPPELFAQLKHRLDVGAMKRLKPGDSVRMPGGELRTIRADELGQNRVVLWPDGAPAPSWIEDVGGHWKVVPRPFIAVRKGSERRPREPRAKAAAPPRKPG
jgi:hypothetical protein